MQSVIRFHKGLFLQPLYVKLWLLLAAVNMVFPLFHLRRLEAQVALGMFFANFMLMIGLTALSGFPRLLGLGASLGLL